MLSNYEVATNHLFAEDYKKKLVDYSFGMTLREGNWDEKLMEAGGFYTNEYVDLHQLSLCLNIKVTSTNEYVVYVLLSIKIKRITKSIKYARATLLTSLIEPIIKLKIALPIAETRGRHVNVYKIIIKDMSKRKLFML